MFKKPKQQTKQRGQGMVEYIIIVALIAIAGIAAFGYFGQTVKHQVAGMAAELSGGSGTAEVANAVTTAQSAATVAATKNKMGTYTDQNTK
ncbi:MAG: hypothetical protein V4805_16405 [Pseudomonadota bacterium]